MRRDLHALLPEEDLAGYAHPERIKRSYLRAKALYGSPNNH